MKNWISVIILINSLFLLHCSDFSENIEKILSGVKSPVFSLASGAYVVNQNVSLQAEENTKIYYTNDGSAPSLDSQGQMQGSTKLYSSALPTPANYKAVAYVKGKDPSPVAEANYFTLAPVASITASDGSFNDKIELQWLGNPQANKIYIYRSLDGTSFARIAEVNGNATNYIDKTVTPSTNYHYKITAVDKKAVETTYSNVDIGYRGLLVLFEENFDLLSTGTLPIGNWLPAAEGPLTQDTANIMSGVSSSAPNSLYLSNNPFGAWDGFFDGAKISLGNIKPLYIRFKYYQGGTGWAHSSIHLGDDNLPVNNGAITINLAGSGSFVSASSNGSAATNLSQYIWHTFELKNIDFNTQKFDLYINGSLWVGGISFSNPTLSFTKMYISIDWADGLYLDDFYMY